MPRKGQKIVPENWSETRRRWRAMMARCYYQKDPRNRGYRTKGITVCREWHSFPAFFAFVRDGLGFPPQDDKRWTLDRVDNSRGYEPGNVRWASYVTQLRNRDVNRRVEFRGEHVVISELAERFGLRPGLLFDRICRSGWSAEQAVSEPVNKGRRLRERTSKHEIRIAWAGEEKTLAQWCRQLNVSRILVYDRMKSGWTFERAISAPRLGSSVGSMRKTDIMARAK